MTFQKIHIAFVLRYKEDFASEDLYTVPEHNKIQRANGKVWFGKFGVPIRPPTLEICSASNVQTEIILVRSGSDKKISSPRVHIASLSKAQNGQPKPNLVPEYYRKHCARIDTWFCLDSQLIPLTDRETNTWVIISSGQTVAATLKKCSQTFFLVTKHRDLAAAQSLLSKGPQTKVRHFRIAA